MNKNIEKRLVKFLMNAANTDELETLTNWLKKKKNKKIFESYVRTNYAMNIKTNKFNTEKAKKNYLKEIREDKKIVNKRKTYKILKYAVAVVILFGMGYFFQQGEFNNTINIDDETLISVSTQIKPGTDKATLTLENGEHVPLVKGTSFQTSNAKSNGEQIVYQTDNTKPKKLFYNYLTTPRGGQFKLTLSDGTKVWLNSESQLKYPVSFIKGKTRQVELVYGELYFHVSPSSENNGSKFIVKNKFQEVKVLGTEFNIKAYKDEENVYTTLVEGKVAVSTSDNNVQTLSPNQQLNLNKSSNKVVITTDIDIYRIVSWKNDVLSFKNKSLKEIMKVVSRWYDINVVFKNTQLQALTFNGSLDKKLGIKEILSIIERNTNDIQYKIKDKTIELR